MRARGRGRAQVLPTSLSEAEAVALVAPPLHAALDVLCARMPPLLPLPLPEPLHAIGDDDGGGGGGGGGDAMVTAEEAARSGGCAPVAPAAEPLTLERFRTLAATAAPPVLPPTPPFAALLPPTAQLSHATLAAGGVAAVGHLLIALRGCIVAWANADAGGAGGGAAAAATDVGGGDVQARSAGAGGVCPRERSSYCVWCFVRLCACRCANVCPCECARARVHGRVELTGGAGGGVRARSQARVMRQEAVATAAATAAAARIAARATLAGIARAGVALLVGAVRYDVAAAAAGAAGGNATDRAGVVAAVRARAHACAASGSWQALRGTAACRSRTRWRRSRRGADARRSGVS